MSNTFDDGSGNAPTGTPLLPGILNGYVVRPPWMVAGVDYAVGAPPGTALLDPGKISIDGITVNPTEHTVWITGSNITLNGYDFSLDGGWGIFINPGATNILVENSKFVAGANNQVPINAGDGVGNLTILNNTFDGGTGSNAIWALVNYNGSGTFTAEYNSFLNAPADAIDFNVGTMTTIVKYNLFDGLGTDPLAHADSVQHVQTTVTNAVIAFNTIYETFADGLEGIQIAGSNGSVQLNTSVENNVIVAPGPALGMSYSVAVIQDPANVINGVVVDNNYIDFTGAFGPFYTATGSNLTFAGNVNLSNGQILASPAGTASSDVSGVSVSASNGTEAVGVTITFSLLMDKVEFVTGTPMLALNNGAAATYVSGSGTNTLLFSYTVASTDTAVSELAITGVTFPAGASINDDNGNPAILSGANVKFPGLAIRLSIGGAAAGQTVVDTSSLSPFSNLFITDSASGQTDTLTVTLSSARNGSLSNLAGGSYDAATGVYTDTGTLAEVTAALDGLVFTPTTNQVLPGQTVSTSFTITDTDTAGATVTDTTTTVAATGTQFLSGGGSITASGTVESLEFGGTAGWIVTSAATVEATSNVTVGVGGSGTLLVNDGAFIIGLGTFDVVSGTLGSVASVTVDGAGSGWISTGELIIGDFGSGTVTVENQAAIAAFGTATASTVVLGATTGDSGTLSVTGGSQALLFGLTEVGDAGSGVLEVTNQATVQTGGNTGATQGLVLGLAAGGSGHAVVAGANSVLANTGRLVIGDAGLGSFAIETGGTVITSPEPGTNLPGAVIANTAGADGSSVTVSDVGSYWEINGLLEVGAGGAGVLQIGSGALVAANSLDVAVDKSTTGQIDLTGTGTELLIDGTATVGDDGTATLSILDGATFAAASLTIGSLGDSSAAVVVSGSGSLLHLSGALNVGSALGAVSLTVGAGATVQAAVADLRGAVVLQGGLLDPDVEFISQGQTVGGFGTIAGGFILNEGVIQAGGTDPSQKLLKIAGTVVGGGTLTVNGVQPGSNPAGLLQINAGGTLELTGPVLNAATTTFNDNLPLAGTYTVDNSVVDVCFTDGNGVLLIDDIAGFGGTITSHQKGDSLVIAGGTLSGLGVTNGNTLTVVDTGNGGTDQIIFASAISGSDFNIVNGDTIQVACFAAGTRIETATGPVAVEDLQIGQRVVTPEDGGCAPIVWIGQREIDCARHPRPDTTWPVRVRAGTFGPGMPARTLYLSPDHAVFVDGVLAPVKLLIDGINIVQVKRAAVTYYHVELPRHVVILAEGLPVESYLDTGDRANFGRGGEVIQLFPDFSSGLTPDTAKLWETLGAAQLVMAGAELEAVRATVEANARRPKAWSRKSA